MRDSEAMESVRQGSEKAICVMRTIGFVTACYTVFSPRDGKQFRLGIRACWAPVKCDKGSQAGFVHGRLSVRPALFGGEHDNDWAYHPSIGLLRA